LFSGRITALKRVAKRYALPRLNPFVFRAYYCGRWWSITASVKSLNPFVFRAYYCGEIVRTAECLGGLNPFVFRAYYCDERKENHEKHRKSQSLCFQGVLLRQRKLVRLPTSKVSIPLFSGRITARSATALRTDQVCLNPFVFRAYYCGSNGGAFVRLPGSQSLCFQGVLLRPSVHQSQSSVTVSIPLFSGRITAPNPNLQRLFKIRLNPFVFRAYYCVTHSLT